MVCGDVMILFKIRQGQFILFFPTDNGLKVLILFHKRIKVTNLLQGE